MVKACVKICHDVTSLSELLSIVDERRCYGHNAVMFGAVCGCLGISDVEVVRSLFLFNTLRTVIAAAVRLGVVGAIKVRFCYCSHIYYYFISFCLRKWLMENGSL